MIRWSRPVVLLLITLTQLVTALVDVHNVTYQPAHFGADVELTEDQERTVMIEFELSNGEFEEEEDWPTIEIVTEVRLSEYHHEVVRVVAKNGTVLVSQEADGGKRKAAVNVTFVGLFLGKTTARFALKTEANGTKLVKIEKPFEIWVSRKPSFLDTLFIVCVAVMIVVATCLLGCGLQLDVVWAVLKRPVAPVIGFLCQFFFMPLIAYGLSELILLPNGLYAIGLGLFASGTAPGGGASNLWTILLKGNSDLSVTMTFVSTVAAFVMIPTWMFLLGPRFLRKIDDVTIRIPFSNILTSLASLVIPLLIGIAIRRFWLKGADWAKKLLRPFSLVILIIIITFGVYTNLFMFYFMSIPVLIAGLLLPWCGYLSGTVLAVIVRQPTPNLVAIAIETGVQNAGIAILMLRLSFPQPDADIASVTPVIVSIFTPLPLLTTLALQHIVRRYENKQKVGVDQEEKQQNADVRMDNRTAVKQLELEGVDNKAMESEL